MMMCNVSYQRWFRTPQAFVKGQSPIQAALIKSEGLLRKSNQRYKLLVENGIFYALFLLWDERPFVLVRVIKPQNECNRKFWLHSSVLNLHSRFYACSVNCTKLYRIMHEASLKLKMYVSNTITNTFCKHFCSKHVSVLAWTQLNGLQQLTVSLNSLNSLNSQQLVLMVFNSSRYATKTRTLLAS